jgi:2-polyprenyl-6-methoxyphenol hydroxylase-like FAD-dependent oxidoreductase
LLSFEKEADSGSIIATIRDNISNSEYQVRTKYLFGADGARSKIVKQLNLPLLVKPGQGVAINVLVRADLSHLVKHRQGNLHWVMQPDKEHPEFGWMGIVRMVKPWHEWMFILFPNRDCDPNIQPSREDYLSRVRDFIGDDTPAEILDVSKWFINEIVAEQYSQGNVSVAPFNHTKSCAHFECADHFFSFCLGDAVHRHPPMNGLGSNTCIQDAFNLAWKMAYVHRGLASPSLLDSYSIERQPVGLSIISRANQAFRDHFNVWNALGTLPEKVEDRQKVLNTLSDATPEGRKQRRAFRDAITQTSHEFHGLGIEMGQVYTGPGIYNEQEQQPYVRSGAAAKDDVLYYSPSTYPGCRVPHVWLNKATPTVPTSTIDLTGHGEFTIFTGVGGNGWKQAADAVATQLGVSINVHSIGFRQDWEDVYFDWEKVRGVDESGAILVRPDRFVAWRSQSQPDNETCKLNLLEVMKSILGYKT